MNDDLSNKRIEECVPVAREIHKLIGDNAETVPMLKADSPEAVKGQLKWYQDLLQEKLLPAITKADIRTADVEFLSALMLQPIDLIREALQDIVTDKVRESILHDMAKKIIAFMGNESSQLPMGDIDKTQAEGIRAFVKEQLNDQLSDVIGRLIDVQAVMDLVVAPYNMVKNILVATRSSAVDGAVAFRFGVKNAEDMRFSHVLAAQAEQAQLSPSAPVQTDAK